MFHRLKFLFCFALMATAMSASAFIPERNLLPSQAAKAQSTQYEYSLMNRLMNVVHEGVWKASFKYDANGNNVTQASPLASSSFSYDPMNRLSSSLISVNSRSFAVTNSYDLNGNRTNIVYPGGLTVGYSYDAENRLSGVTTKYTTNSTKIFSFRYDGASRLTNIVYPNNIAATFGYDAESRVTNYTHGAFLNHVITRDLRGFKTQEDISAGLIPTFTNGLRQTRTHNAADQLLSAGNQTYSYDSNGCLTNANGSAYSYDYDNRLNSAGGVQYLYDASGARIGRITGVSLVVINYFVVAYADPLKRPLAEIDVSGNVTRCYVWAGFRLLAHIAVDGGGDPIIRYYNSDELGSTLALTDENGTVTDEFAYTPYGKCTARTGTTGTPFQWLGGYGVYYDSSTDLHLTLHRAYSANMRRFISSDPMGIDGGVNLYAYGNLNPLFFVDPYGLDAIVLNESKGVFRAGHQGLAVQGAAGWIYLSQDGPNAGGGHSVYYNNQEEMLGDLGGRYDRHFLIQTTTQQDAAIYQSASANLNNPYSANPFNKNRFHCGDLVSTALQAGSVPTGPEPFGNRPNTAFNNIRTANTLQPSSAKSSTFLPQSGLNRPSPVTSFPSQTINRSSQGPLK